MKKFRIFNLVSLILNLSIIYFTISGVIYCFRSDVIREEEWQQFIGIHSLRFFTVLSNIFVAIVALMLVVYCIKNLVNEKYEFPKWLILLKHISTTAVAVTFVTVVVLLAPSYAISGKSYFALFVHNNFFMHFLTPICAAVSFVWFETPHTISLKQSLLAILPVALYSVLYTTMVVFVGEANGGWPDFYNFTFGGHNWIIPISAIMMLALTFGLGTLLMHLHNKRVKNEANDVRVKSNK